VDEHAGKKVRAYRMSRFFPQHFMANGMESVQ